ncbi:Heat stress transcription factor A-4b [Nymphaea thermarum]|nr:Heat stress transcription factor A-4b [Nymphaea thermarum]
MDGPSGGSAPPPFLTKTYEMVDDSSTDSVVSWSEGGNSFIVWNQPEFERDLLSKYFKHNNFSSFIRQLNTYGFRKIDPDQWEFANDEFRKGQRHLLKNIHRRKPTYSHSLPPNQRQVHSSGTLSESEKQELEEEIGTLKHDKSVLMLELRRHMQQQNKLDLRSQTLVEKLHLAEQRQQKMLAIVDQTVNKPEITSFLVQLCEASRYSSIANKKRKLPRPDKSSEEADAEDNRTMDFQMPGSESSDFSFRQPLDVEAFYDMESCLKYLEMFFRRIGQASGEEMDIFDDLCQPSAAVFESQAVSPCADAFSRPQSPGPYLPPSQLTGSGPSLELTESTHRETTVTAPDQPRHTQLMADRSRSSMVDMNLMPATPELRSSKKTNVLATSTGAPARVNDVFWEQFLTETPGSMDSLEVQSGMHDRDDKNLAARSSENDTFWWNKKNVDHLTEQMGQLTSAEKT